MFMGRVSDMLLLITVCWVLSARYVLNNFKDIPLFLFHSVLAWQEEFHDQWLYQMPSKAKKNSTSYFSIICCLSNFFSGTNYGMVCGMMISRTKLIIEETVITV